YLALNVALEFIIIQVAFEHFKIGTVTGETGTGKSTFINAYRGLRHGDEGAAETGVTETTTEPTPYEHPTIPNVVLWDLPGVGSIKFTAKTYVKKMQFEKYDFFLIISDRFKENDFMLAKAIQKRKNKFYFIRSKVDSAVQHEGDEGTILSKIRKDCQENLKELGNPPVHLGCSYCLWWDCSCTGAWSVFCM
uniref:IRG-type G domain-containing protein n=1 Tax=Astyanax mexicanus TaxID=7994 RepID=A0A8B9HW36_ASTMX